MFFSVFSRIAILFLIILLGALARWSRLLNERSTNKLCRLAIEVTLPFLYLYTLSTNLSAELFSSLAMLPLFAVGLTFGFYLLSRLLLAGLNLNPQQRRSFIFLLTFPNYGFLAIPLVFALFGQEGLVRIFVFNLGITLLYWTLGVSILSDAAKLRTMDMLKNLVNPATIALLLGLVLGLASWRLPQLIAQPCKWLGSASIPLALIVVGSVLAQRKTQARVALPTIARLVFCRLILLPGLVLLLVNLFSDLPDLLRVIIVLQAAMPSAATTPILTERFGGDSQLAASGVFFTTLLSIITVPLFISLALP